MKFQSSKLKCPEITFLYIVEEFRGRIFIGKLAEGQMSQSLSMSHSITHMKSITFTKFVDSLNLDGKNHLKSQNPDQRMQ